MMVLLPLLLYPLMIVGMTLLFSAITQSQEETTYQVAFADLGQEREQTLTDLLEKDADTFSYQISVEPFDENDKTIEQALKDGDYDAVLSYEESQKDPYRIYYLEAKDDSGIAAAALKELLEDYNKQLQKQKVQQLGLDADEILNPVRYEEVKYSSTEQTMGNMLGDIVPMLVIISIMMGAIYPAIDVTAGEKERGTLETLLTLPVTNFELIMSKFLAVSVIACVSRIILMSLFILLYIATRAWSCHRAVSLHLQTHEPFAPPVRSSLSPKQTTGQNRLPSIANPQTIRHSGSSPR